MANRGDRHEIDRSSPVPIYHQLKTLLLDEIAAGRYPEGSRVPTEHELCTQYGISRSPVTRALTELAAEGVVIRRRRSGTVVDPGWSPPGGKRQRPTALVPATPWLAIAGLGDRGSAFVDAQACPAEEIQTRLTRAVAAGSAPDVALVDSSDVPDLAAAGFVLRLAAVDVGRAVDELAADHPAVATVGGYGVPAVVRLTGLWLRRDAVLAGAPPATWEELQELTRSARDGDPRIVSPLVMEGGGGSRAVAEAAAALLASHGAALVEEGEITIASPAGEAALGTLRSLVAESLMSADAAAYGPGDVARRLGSGAAVAAIGGSDLVPEIAAAAGIETGELWDRFLFTPLPGARDAAPATAMGSWSFVVLRQSAAPHAALTAIERLLALAEHLSTGSTGLVPARSSIVGFPIVADPRFPLRDGLRAAVTYPGTVAAGIVSGEVRRMIQAAITGGSRLSAAAERCAIVLAAVTGLPIRAA